MSQKSTEKTPPTLPELREMLQRQEKILTNRNFIAKLPDKGEKLKNAHEKLLKEIAEKDKLEQSLKLFSALSITSGSSNTLTKTKVDNIEWENNLNSDNRNECLDSDDDSDSSDPLAIIASSTDMTKKLIILKEEEKLITEKDLQEIAKFNSSNDDDIVEVKSDSNLNDHTKYICTITDKSNLSIRQSFKPYKTLISNSHDPSKEILYKRGKHWEVTAATPPPIIHGPVKEISLQESFKLQEDQDKQYKAVQIRHASEKLAAILGKNVSDLPLSLIQKSNYREHNEIDSESDDSDKETSDQEIHDDEPKDGGVVFTITN